MIQITLSDEDVDRLAAALEKRITDKVIGTLANGPLFDQITEQAKARAEYLVNSQQYALEVSARVKDMLKNSWTDTELRRALGREVQSFLSSKEGLRREVANQLFNAARDFVEELNPNKFDN